MDESKPRSAFKWSIWLSCADTVLRSLLYLFQSQVKLLLEAPAVDCLRRVSWQRSGSVDENCAEGYKNA